jgi:hypothetical protein
MQADDSLLTIIKFGVKGPRTTTKDIEGEVLLEKHDHREIKENKCRNKTQKIHNTIETQIYVFHPMWVRPPEKFPGPSFIINQQMKGYNLQQTRYNFPFFLS